MHVFNMNDYESRHMAAWDLSDTKDGYVAAAIVRRSVKRTGKRPSYYTTDGHPPYGEAYVIVLKPGNPLEDHCVHITHNGRDLDRPTVHTANAGISGARQGQQQQRPGAVQQQYPAGLLPCPRYRGIKTVNSHLSAQFAVWYNFVRIYGEISRTPMPGEAAAAGVKVHGDDR